MWCAAALALGACATAGAPTEDNGAAVEEDAAEMDPEDTSRGVGSLGITAVSWPETLDEARELTEALPDELDGMKLAVEQGSIDVTVQYQIDEQTVLHLEARQGLPSADEATNTAALGATLRFYQYYRGAVSRPYCQPRTFAGTAETYKGRGRDPEVAADIDVPDEFFWYSCVVGKSPDPDVGMTTLGWVSGPLSWFCTSPDPELIEEVVDIMATGGQSA